MNKNHKHEQTGGGRKVNPGGQQNSGLNNEKYKWTQEKCWPFCLLIPPSKSELPFITYRRPQNFERQYQYHKGATIKIILD